MEEYGGDDGRIGEEREDLHLAATCGTEQRQHVVDAREQDGPSDSRAGAGEGSGGRLSEATSTSAAGASGTSSGRPRATTWGLSLAFGARTPW